jgi:hypothetical protein
MITAGPPRLQKAASRRPGTRRGVCHGYIIKSRPAVGRTNTRINCDGGWFWPCRIRSHKAALESTSGNGPKTCQAAGDETIDPRRRAAHGCQDRQAAEAFTEPVAPPSRRCRGDQPRGAVVTSHGGLILIHLNEANSRSGPGCG